MEPTWRLSSEIFFEIGSLLTPIAKIEIAIPIPIFIRNWDRDRDPDLNSKIICDPIAITTPAIADLLGDLLKIFMSDFKKFCPEV